MSNIELKTAKFIRNGADLGRITNVVQNEKEFVVSVSREDIDDILIPTENLVCNWTDVTMMPDVNNSIDALKTILLDKSTEPGQINFNQICSGPCSDMKVSQIDIQVQDGKFANTRFHKTFSEAEIAKYNN